MSKTHGFYLFGALALDLSGFNRLLLLNKLWMNVGLFLGKIFSPIILGFIFLD